MMGPTPVSALLHAATLVVAGPIVLIKVCSLTQYHLTTIQLLGMSTALLGATIALGQSDSKSVIAYSTMSQFGYIISASTLVSEGLAYYHISTHATFKAALFACAGVAIHSSYDMQDLRSLGGLVTSQPVTYIVLLSSASSLIALPYMSGSYSKDLIIEMHSTQYGKLHLYLISLVVALLTIVYTLRLVLMLYVGHVNQRRIGYESSHEANLYALIPMTMLSLLAIGFGYISQPLIVASLGINDSLSIADL